MSKFLFPAFILIPIIELQLLLMVHDEIGFGNTLFLVLITGVFGVNLAKREGFALLKRIQQKLSRGEMPTDELLNGVIILVGGVLLITPGVLTDVFGLTCLIPIFRKIYSSIISKLFKNKVTVFNSSQPKNSTSGSRVDVDWTEIND